MKNTKIRNDVEKIIFPNGYDEKSSFQKYAELDVIGNQIIASLLKKRKKNKKISEDLMMFFTDAKNQRTGFLSTVYGCTGMISLMNRYNIELNKEQKDFLKESIIYLIGYVRENKYTLNPYIDDRLNDEIFHNKDYIGAMTWMLSLLTSVRIAINNGTLIFDDNDDINYKIMKEIRYIVKSFTSSICGKTNDNPIGWGFTKKSEVSLFFTYSVLEAYSDFEDNICPPCPKDEDENEWIDKKWDKELLQYLDEDDHLKQWKQQCQTVAMNAWKTYKNVLKTDFVSDAFLDSKTIVTKSDILKANSSNALFNNIYLVFILIFGYVNKRVETKSEKEDVIMTMNAALQNVQRMYEQLRKEGYSYIVDNYIIQFGKCEDVNSEAISKLNYEMLVDAKITPILVKANNMIAFYITQYPVKEMGALFEDLFANIDSNDWVWDNNTYDVKNTERYIEAIADFYLYYESYEKRYVQRIIEDKEYEKSLKEQLRIELRNEAEKSFREEMEKAHESKISEVKASFTIENAIVDRIINIFNDTITKISESQGNDNIILNDVEKSILSGLLNIMNNNTINND